MRLQKHLYGFVVFVIILTSAVFIYDYIHGLYPKRVRVRYDDPVAAPSTNVPPAATPELISYDTKLVSLDFINKQSYTALELRLGAGQPAPDRLWVTTFFFAPKYPGRGWTTRREIRRPFADGDVSYTVASGPCNWCGDSDAPKAGYFARVYVSTEAGDDSDVLESRFSREITTAVPVVVQAERKTRR
ncbi:MAG TPA: hypothetical protein VJ715_15320 [Pyrinomonadaceae bacterium]|nr:hypothetical protein [Pyrinomonadaceae bacterium]